MELEALKYIGVGLCSIAMGGAAVGVGNIFASLMGASSRNPSMHSKMSTAAFIGAGLSEAMGLFAFLIALLLLFFI